MLTPNWPSCPQSLVLSCSLLPIYPHLRPEWSFWNKLDHVHFAQKALKPSHGLRIEHELLSVSGKKISVWPRVPSQPLHTCSTSVFPPCPDLHPHRNIFQAPNTTWFHSLLFSTAFLPRYILPLCWPTDTWCRIPLHTRLDTHPSWHSSRHLLCETLSGPFTSVCIWRIYLCGSLSCTISVL